MDGAVEKLDLYDFFGIFLAGAITILMMLWLEIPMETVVAGITSEWLQVISFLVGSYLLGLVLRDFGSILSKMAKQGSIYMYLLDNNRVITDNDELTKMREMANDIKQANEVDKEKEKKKYNEYIFRRCRAYVYYKGKGDKDKRRSSYVALSRSVFLSSLCLSVCGVVLGSECWRILLTIFICLVMGYRMIWFDRYRVLEILRLYRMLKEDEQVCQASDRTSVT